MTRDEKVSALLKALELDPDQVAHTATTISLRPGVRPGELRQPHAAGATITKCRQWTNADWARDIVDGRVVWNPS